MQAHSRSVNPTHLTDFKLTEIDHFKADFKISYIIWKSDRPIVKHWTLVLYDYMIDSIATLLLSIKS